MEIQGYPAFVFLAVLVVGMLLAAFKPYRGFLFALVLLTAGHVTKFNLTRLAGLGPYLNLNDVCVLVVWVAFFFDRVAGGTAIRVPQIVHLMFFVLVLSVAQSFWRFGWTYESFRALRWAVQMPVLLFIGANLVTSSDRAKGLLTALLAGALLAAAQHLWFAANVWRTQSVSMETLYLVRTIGYWGGGLASAFLLTALILGGSMNSQQKIWCLLGSALLVATLFLNMTRSLWLATAGSIPCLFVIYGIRCSLGRIAKLMAILCVVAAILTVALHYVAPGFKPIEMVTGRFQALTGDRVHMGTREMAFRVEVGEWSRGTFVLGRGLGFYQALSNAAKGESDRVAFAHLGYVTYLSQLGAIGLFIYGVLLPLGTIRAGRYLWLYERDPAVRCVGLVGGASMICLSIMFVMSGQFLSPGYEGPSVLYGAIWALGRSCPAEAVSDSTSVSMDDEVFDYVTA